MTGLTEYNSTYNIKRIRHWTIKTSASVPRCCIVNQWITQTCDTKFQTKTAAAASIIPALYPTTLLHDYFLTKNLFSLKITKIGSYTPKVKRFRNTAYLLILLLLLILNGRGWRGGLVVSVLDQRPRGRGFESCWLRAVA